MWRIGPNDPMIWGLDDLMIQIVSRHRSKWPISRPNVSRNNYGDHSSGVRDRGLLVRSVWGRGVPQKQTKGMRLREFCTWQGGGGPKILKFCGLTQPKGFWHGFAISWKFRYRTSLNLLCQGANLCRPQTTSCGGFTDTVDWCMSRLPEGVEYCMKMTGSSPDL